ncbi:UxaA family hydrolase [Halobacteria archaeon AArc-curdl1]|uniref:UxaA family hydrolase n=1 Tax=Natronosalvus hydrolyticus TaxID=2979988 RepID=A0AAP2Z6N6_9EURY|nr:UxaA family hydrolase [Halobacteria archaeon AArc-curdl1]
MSAKPTDNETGSNPENTVNAYVRSDGRIGVRNRVLVLPSVICSHVVADRIAGAVPNAVSAPHDHGCGQIGADKEQTERTFHGVGANPNIAGTVVVGLGCETIQSNDVATRLETAGVRVEELSIQRAGGTDPAIERGVEVATKLTDTDETERTTVGLDDITVGVVSTDVQSSTLNRADPLVGEVIREVVDAGGRAIVAGTERVQPHASDIVANAANAEIASQLEELLETQARLPARTIGLRRQAADRSFPDLARQWGELPIREVIPYGASSELDSGVALVDAPSGFAEAATALVAAGAHVVVHVTADGIPTGHPIAPVIKVTGNEDTYEALADDIDVLATDPSTTLVDTVRQVLNGEASCAEQHGLSEFAITRVGPSM